MQNVLSYLSQDAKHAKLALCNGSKIMSSKITKEAKFASLQLAYFKKQELLFEHLKTASLHILKCCKML